MAEKQSDQPSAFSGQLVIERWSEKLIADR
jgi:hypothetical protein